MEIQATVVLAMNRLVDPGLIAGANRPLPATEGEPVRRRFEKFSSDHASPILLHVPPRDAFTDRRRCLARKSSSSRNHATDRAWVRSWPEKGGGE